MSVQPPAPQLLSHPPKAVELAAVERELTNLWRHGKAGEADLPVTRACMSNLIIACRTGNETAAVASEIPAIVARHPARVFLLLLDTETDGTGLQCSATTHGRVVEGRQQVLSEHLTIKAHGAAARRVPSAVRGLLIGDLPTALWWATREAPPRAGELLTELADLASQVIYDSLGWPDPPRDMVAVTNWASGDRIRQAVSDLAWRRLKLWRRLLAQALDPAVAPGVLETIREVTVEHGPHAMTQAWLLTGWLALGLGWRPAGGRVSGGAEALWQFQSPHGVVPVAIRRLAEGEAEIQRVRIVSAPRGRLATIACSSAGPGRLAVTSDTAPGVVRTLSALPQDRAELVARQLPDLARDALFLDCLAFARTMAQALLR